VTIVSKFWSLNLLEPQGPVQACSWKALSTPVFIVFKLSMAFILMVFSVDLLAIVLCVAVVLSCAWLLNAMARVSIIELRLNKIHN
jgi:hypothetical protein